MAASLLMTKRPMMVRASSSKNSNPYMTMNKTASPSSSPHIPDEIMPGLYLTDLFTARQTLLPNYPAPHRPQIKYVLSLLDNTLSQPHPKPDSRKDQFVQELVLIDDVPDADLLVHLGPLCDWIATSLSHADGSVLVHCHMGQSRSAAIVIAYMMRTQHIDADRAIERVKRRRGVVRPNEGFVKQLRLWWEMGCEVWEEVEVEIEVPRVDGQVEVAVDGQAEVQEGVKKVETVKVKRRKEGYEGWKREQERRTKRYLDNLL